MKTVTFILSSERSGSTWLGYVLGSHKDCAFVGEFYRGWQPEIQGPCSSCAAKGLSECEVLDGAEYVPVKRAYDFAFERLHVSHLIDSSKKIEWASRYIGSGRDFNVNVVHLIRDPRGFYESQRRRDPQPQHAMLSGWVDYNQEIQELIRRTGVPATTVFYDELAAPAARAFHPLCEFLGFAFDPEAVSYWEKVHHAFAGNGASDPVLRQVAASADALSARNAGSAPMLVTGDDKYYEQRRHSTFTDERWKTRLSAEEKTEIVTNRNIQDFFAQFGRTLVASGIAPVGAASAESAGATAVTIQERLAAAEERVAVLEQIVRSRDEALNALLQSRGWRMLNRVRELRGRSKLVSRTILGILFRPGARGPSHSPHHSSMQVDCDSHRSERVPATERSQKT